MFNSQLMYLDHKIYSVINKLYRDVKIQFSTHTPLFYTNRLLFEIMQFQDDNRNT